MFNNNDIVSCTSNNNVIVACEFNKNRRFRWFPNCLSRCRNIRARHRKLWGPIGCLYQLCRVRWEEASCIYNEINNWWDFLTTMLRLDPTALAQFLYHGFRSCRAEKL